MTCSWCGTRIADYGSHFASYAGQPCKFAALDNQNGVQRLDRGLNADATQERARLRNRTLRQLARTGRRDRLEDRAPTAAPASRDPRGRA